MLKKTKVVMLSTKEKSKLVLSFREKSLDQLINPKLTLIKEDSNYQLSNIQSQHLYFVSDDEIKEGDWVINLNSIHSHKELCRIDNKIELERYAKKEGNNCKKIIATTDSSLGKYVDGNNPLIGEFIGIRLPQPSQSFLEVFVKWYNDSPTGSMITEVLVEYEVDKYDKRNQYEDVPSGKYWEDEPIPKSPDNLYTNAKYLIPKVNSKDNTITIRQIKNSWNREEMRLKMKTQVLIV